MQCLQPGHVYTLIINGEAFDALYIESTPEGMTGDGFIERPLFNPHPALGLNAYPHTGEAITLQPRQGGHGEHTPITHQH